MNTKQSAKGKEQRYFHNNTGYIVWDNTHEVVAETAERTGSWYDVMQMYHPEETHGEVTAIY